MQRVGIILSLVTWDIDLWWSPISSLKFSAAQTHYLYHHSKSSLPGSNWIENFMKQNWWSVILFGIYEYDFTVFLSAHLRKKMKPRLIGNSWLDWMEICTPRKYHGTSDSLALSGVYCLAPVYQLAEQLCIATRHKWNNELRCRFHKSD